MRESDLKSSTIDNGVEALIDHSKILMNRNSGIRKHVFHTTYSIQSGSNAPRHDAVDDGTDIPFGARILKVIREGDNMGGKVWIFDAEKHLEVEFTTVHKHDSPNSAAGVPYVYEPTGNTRPHTK